jgi:hypothetical protein
MRRVRSITPRVAAVATLWLAAVGATGHAVGRAQAPAGTLPNGHSLLSGLPPLAPEGPCLHAGAAFLRVRIRGSIRLDVDLHGPGLACKGGPRRGGSGMRMGFAGRVGAAGRMRVIFGIDGAREGRSGRELPTNLTVIFEDEKLLFATQGDGNCTVDRLTQEPVTSGHVPPRPAPRRRTYRVVAHGFCIAPVNDLSGRRRIVVSRFDFAGRADFDAP